MLGSPIPLERIGKKRKPYDLSCFSTGLDNWSIYDMVQFPGKKAKVDISYGVKVFNIRPSQYDSALVPMECDTIQNSKDLSEVSGVSGVFQLAKKAISNGWIQLEKYNLRLKDLATEKYLCEKQAVFPLFYLRRLEFEAMQRIIKDLNIAVGDSSGTRMEID